MLRTVVVLDGRPPVSGHRLLEGGAGYGAVVRGPEGEGRPQPGSNATQTHTRLPSAPRPRKSRWRASRRPRTGRRQGQALHPLPDCLVRNPSHQMLRWSQTLSSNCLSAGRHTPRRDADRRDVLSRCVNLQGPMKHLRAQPLKPSGNQTEQTDRSNLKLTAPRNECVAFNFNPSAIVRI